MDQQMHPRPKDEATSRREQGRWGNVKNAGVRKQTHFWWGKSTVTVWSHIPTSPERISCWLFSSACDVLMEVSVADNFAKRRRGYFRVPNQIFNGIIFSPSEIFCRARQWSWIYTKRNELGTPERENCEDRDVFSKLLSQLIFTYTEIERRKIREKPLWTGFICREVCERYPTKRLKSGIHKKEKKIIFHFYHTLTLLIYLAKPDAKQGNKIDTRLLLDTKLQKTIDNQPEDIASFHWEAIVGIEFSSASAVLQKR